MDTYEELEEIVHSIVDKYGNVPLESLPKKDRYMCLIFNMELEIQNGGFEQFFLNPSGDYTKETIEALTAIGDRETLAIFETLVNLFPNGRPPLDKIQRNEIMRRWTRKQKETCSSFDEDYFAKRFDNTLKKAIDFYKST